MLVRTSVQVLDDQGNPLWSYFREEMVKLHPDGEEMVLRGLGLVDKFGKEAIERIGEQAEGDRSMIKKERES